MPRNPPRFRSGAARPARKSPTRCFSRSATATAEADIEELSSLAALVEGTDCGVTLRELRPGVIKISLRTGPRVDACAVCQKLGGGGHRAAAGATADGTMDEVRSAVLRAYQEVVG